MAKILKDTTVGLHIEYRVVFFPFATYRRCGDVVLLTVLGVPLYRRVAALERILGFGRVRKHAS